MQPFLDEATSKALTELRQKNLYTGIYVIGVTSQIMSRDISSGLRANFSIRIGMKLMAQNESKRILDRVGVGMAFGRRPSCVGVLFNCLEMLVKISDLALLPERDKIIYKVGTENLIFGIEYRSSLWLENKTISICDNK